MIVFTIAQNIVYYGIPRFRAPIEPMLILLAAGAIWWLTHKEKGTLRWIIDNIRQKDEKVNIEAEIYARIEDCLERGGIGICMQSP